MDFPLLFIGGQSAELLPADKNIESGLLETMRGTSGRVPLWPYHRARLERSGRVGVALLESIETFLRRCVASLPDRELRLRLRVGFLDGATYWDLRIEPIFAPAGLDRGVTLHLCHTRLPRVETANPGCKELARSRYNRAMRELPSSDLLHDGLLLDERGHLVETLRCNLLLWRRGQWFTPDLSHCGVRGVMRDWLSERVPIVETALDPDSLAEAEEVAVCNSVRAVLSVQALAGSKSWQPGPHTHRLQNLVAEELW